MLFMQAPAGLPDIVALVLASRSAEQHHRDQDSQSDAAWHRGKLCMFLSAAGPHCF